MVRAEARGVLHAQGQPRPLARTPQQPRDALQDKQIDGINKCKVYLNELRMMFALRHRHIVRCPLPPLRPVACRRSRAASAPPCRLNLSTFTPKAKL